MPTLSLPLLTDHHSHPLLYAAFQQSLDLSETTSWEQAADAINQFSTRKSSPLVVGHGWKDNRFEIPEDTLNKFPPLAVFNLSLHKLVVNEPGRTYLKSQFGDVIDNIDDLEWFETHLRIVWNWFGLLNGSAEALTQFYDHLEGIGVWSAEEMLLIAESEIEYFREADLIHRTRFWSAPETYQSLSTEAQKYVAGIKLFTDGAFGARTAAVESAYSDDEDNRGMLLYTDAELGAEIESACRLSTNSSPLGLAVHAIGDRAIQQLLDQLEQLGESRNRFSEIRIEHAQLISRPQADKAKQMGLILSMQPNFTVDSVDYLDRLGPERVIRNNPFRMLIDEVGFEPGVDLIFGSDGMPHGPKYAIEYSLSHPPYPGQRISPEEFIAGYCQDRNLKRTDYTY